MLKTMGLKIKSKSANFLINAAQSLSNWHTKKVIDSHIMPVIFFVTKQ